MQASDPRRIAEGVTAVRRDGHLALESGPGEWRSNRLVVMEAMSMSGLRVLQYADASLLDDSEVLAKVKAEAIKGPFDLRFLPGALRSNREIIMAAVSQEGLVLEYADHALRSDSQIVLAAVTKEPFALELANAAFRSNKDFLIEAVSKNGSVLRFADDAMRSDKDVVMAAVRENGRALQYADYAFRSDKDVVMAAVSQNGRALEFADDALRSDKYVVIAAVSQNGSALPFADRAFRSDKDVVIAAVSADPEAFNLASRALRAEADVVQAALSHNHQKTCVYACRVTTLAGNSCSRVFAANTDELYEYEEFWMDDLRRELLARSAWELSLDKRLVFSQGELLHMDAAEPQSDQRFSLTLRRNELNEFQLVLRSD